MAVEIVRASRAHVPHLAKTMRPEDAAEVRAQGRTPLQALTESLGRSDRAWAALEDGLPIAMWGVSELGVLGREAVAWCLTGEGVERHHTAFLRGSRSFAHHLRTRYETVWNLVDARYGRAIRWVRWLGFSIHGEVTVHGVPFYLVVLRRDV